MKMYEYGRYKRDSSTSKQGLRYFNFLLIPKGIIGKLYLVTVYFKVRKLILLKFNEDWLDEKHALVTRQSWQTKETCVEVAGRWAFRMHTDFQPAIRQSNDGNPLVPLTCTVALIILSYMLHRI